MSNENASPQSLDAAQVIAEVIDAADLTRGHVAYLAYQNAGGYLDAWNDYTDEFHGWWEASADAVAANVDGSNRGYVAYLAYQNAGGYLDAWNDYTDEFHGWWEASADAVAANVVGSNRADTAALA